MQNYDRRCHVWYPARPCRRCDPSRVWDRALILKDGVQTAVTQYLLIAK